MKRLSSSNSSISKSYDHNWFSLINRFHVKLCEFSKNPQKIIFSESANQKNIQTRQIVQNLIGEISLGKHILNIYGKNRKKLEIHQKVHFWHFFCSQIAILHQKVVITFQNRTYKRNSSGVKRCAARIYSTLYITSKTGVSSKIEIWAKYSRKMHVWHVFCSKIAILHQKVTITLQSRTFKKNRSGVKRSAPGISSTSYITSERCVSSKIEKIAKNRRKVHFLPFLAVKWHFLTKK